MLVRRLALKTVGLKPVLSLRQNTASLNLLQVRLVRTKSGSRPRDRDDKDNQNESKQSQSKKDEESQEEDKIDFENMTPQQQRRLKIFGYLTFMTSGLISLYIIKSWLDSDAPKTRKGAIPFDDFIEKFLKHGEVQRITYVPSQKGAVAEVYDGAIIDGRPWPSKYVMVRYDRETDEGSGKFEADIRRVEESLGVAPQNRLPIHVFKGVATRRMVEGFVGLTIMFFLFTQYGRVFRRRLQEQARKAAKKD